MAPSRSSRNLILDQLRVTSEQLLQLMQRLERLEHIVSDNELRHRACRVARRRSLQQMVLTFSEDLDCLENESE